MKNIDIQVYYKHILYIKTIILSETDFHNVENDGIQIYIPDLIKLEPAFKDNLWGGTKLRTVFGKKCDYDIIAESWELSAHPAGQSVIADGVYAGMFFGEFIEKIGKSSLGWKCISLESFPILIKFIDAMIYRFRFIRMMIMLLRMKMNTVRTRCGISLIVSRELFFTVDLTGK